MRTDGRTDMAKLIVAFHNFAKELKNYSDSLTTTTVFTYELIYQLDAIEYLLV